MQKLSLSQKDIVEANKFKKMYVSFYIFSLYVIFQIHNNSNY